MDLEKAFDRVPREVLYWSLRRKGISEKLVRVIRSMYVGSSDNGEKWTREDTSI